ncbi:hypothetical protein P879_09259 [Paragonimus westermani]|uniref:ERO1-like protein alpha n=1 Tax=Paragonimus westermani TaxID=34504 RepID=A0A8T0D470_9TREM|nr:hypothetical protein P879_09259 [Paragonimus westermani]
MLVVRSAVVIFLVIELWTCVSETCFTKLKGRVVDIDADIDFVNQLNNFEILPRLNSIVERDYFHYFEVNLERGCPFFSEDLRCGLKDCHVSGCPVEEVPGGLLTESMLTTAMAHNKYSEDLNKQTNVHADEIDCQLAKVDNSLSEEQKVILDNWTIHDAMNEVNFFDLDDDSSGKMIWVDLIKNPERYTGYKGAASNRIWHMIHAENCFDDGAFNYRTFAPSPETLSCLEKRAFYRLVSGLHTSITVHLCARYPRNLFCAVHRNFGVDTVKPSDWGPNVEEFRRRFHPEFTREGLERLHNLYFAYLVELRALAKAAPYLRTLMFYTGNAAADAETRQAVDDLLKIVEARGSLFNEGQLFAEQNTESVSLKQQFRRHFHNISRIMDCVGCEKCRLWGKLQTQGMGTALKILFASSDFFQPKFQLSRREIVALFNALNRLSVSIGTLPDFC